MITNQRQYRITRRWIKNFEAALALAEEPQTYAALDPLLQKAMRESVASQLDDLREQAAHYDALQSGQVKVLELNSLVEIPGALIRARTAAGLTQKELARRLGLKEQQIQRYEATRYAGVSLERLQAVADALGVTIHERVTLPSMVDTAPGV